MTDLSLNYLYRLPKKPTLNPPLLLLLHGYGSNEADLFSFAQELPDSFLIVSARAPLTLGMQSYAWYTINFDSTDGNFSDIGEALLAKKMILKFTKELKTIFSFNSDNISLLGFSQGSILSYSLALSYPEIFKNVVALSGYIKEELFEIKDASAYKDLDFFISHGTQDQVIPLQWAQKAPQYLDALNIANVYKTYPTGHSVTPQCFYDFNLWLQAKI
ncbi:MAG: phospholipase [Flavobacteriaceae bacterium]|nr:phospholipase [Flavobacteriaceae bacterium]